MERYALVLALVCCASLYVQGVDWRIQRLNKFQSKYNNSRSDIIFLMDVSGSVNNAGFATEKEFINSLLSKISVQPIATRVSLITFGRTVRKNIDYVNYNDNLFSKMTKCEFKKQFGVVGHRHEGATNMNGALKKAREIIDRSKARGIKRNNVNTVIVLLTDGWYNEGGEPYTVAKDLRSNKYHAEIFGVGVGYGLQRVLQGVSGSTDNVITARSFNDFGGLATRIRGDQTEKLYISVAKSNCGITCDPNAKCSCGTLSGIYQCACLPGYKGSGVYGQCHKCPHGSYKTFTSPDPNCKPCPANAITKGVGSTSITQCYCKPGFTGYPNIGQPCKPVECVALPTTIANGKVTSCGKYYKETCTFTCNKNYNIVNEAVTSKKLECLINGRWDRSMPACVSTTCQKVTNPPKVLPTCSGNKVGDKCSFKCEQGYNLMGANERECKNDGQWSHSLPHCEVVTCPAVRKIDNVNIEPVHCMTKSTNFNDGCAYSCKPGFKFVSGVQKRVCSHDGTWVGDELICKDLTPPTIQCREPISAETDLGQSYKEISWEAPDVIDNSITGSDDITVTHTPATIKSPYKFPIGITQVSYTASDQNGNSDSCTFRVEIFDREKPKFTSCPKDISQTAASVGANTIKVTWDAPTFTDNSGQVSLVYHTHNSNSQDVPVGGVVPVKYTIQDPSKLTADCQFFIRIKAKTCPHREPPINGALSCSYVPNTGQFCHITCNAKYEFNGPKAYYYICGLTARWSSIPLLPGKSWPDCTVTHDQLGAKQRIEFFYFSGNCESSKDQIRSKFLVVMGKFLMRSKRSKCSDPAYARVCDAENIKVKCGATQDVNGRKRRSAQNEMYIEIDIDVKSSESLADQESAVKELTSSIQNINSDTSAEAESLKKMVLPTDTLVLQRVQAVGSINAICADGQVFGPLKPGDQVSTCVSCLAGQYFNTDSKSCQKCPKGTYTENAGLLGCPPCPPGYTTVSAGTTKSEHCRKPCEPGTSSDDGLAPCRACPVGSYQRSYEGKSCNKCPGITVTADEGSTQLDQCRMQCPKGMFSKTGLAPCNYCPKGFYQPSEAQKDCKRCPGTYSTDGEGSQQRSQCKLVDNCVSSPCLNGGSCAKEFNDFSCTCKPGYRGKRCEEEKNECADTPCYGKAACIDKIDGFECICPPLFSGKFCSDKQPSCTSSWCQNGGSCGESPEGPLCTCAPGWTGKFCERTVNECDSKPCGPGATCIDTHRGKNCVCAVGYTGPSCHELIDHCVQNNQCLNGGTCVNGVNHFTCQCKPGYGGDRCDVDINECASNPCRNGAICIDEVNSYKCKCAAGYYGDHCQQAHTSSNFDLVFDRKVQGYAETDFYQILNSFTASFWLKVQKDMDTGTIMSYAYGNEENFQDNGLVIRDPDSLTLVLLGDDANLDISVADNQWHHVAITWSGHSGQYRGYKDGMKVAEGTINQGKFVPAHGIFVLGQEQDEIGRNFTAAEAFNGRLSQFNLWNKVLPEKEILTLASYRCIHSTGNVIAWADFESPSKEVKREVDFCRTTNTKFSSWLENSQSPCGSQTAISQCVQTSDSLSVYEMNLIDISCSAAGFSCGDQKRIDTENPTTCPTSTKNRFECPYSGRKDCSSSSCSRRGQCIETVSGYVCRCNDGYSGSDCQNSVPCQHISSISNGYVQASGNTVTFSCKKGYKLKGSSRLTCNAGRFSSKVPVCEDINECQTNACGSNSRCTNLPGTFQCSCLPGFKLSTSTLCVDVDECKVNNGNCQDKCMNTHGSYSCGCRSGYRISIDKRSCEDLNECSSSSLNNCAQDCINLRGSYKCQCRPGYNLASDRTTCNAAACSGVGSPANGKISQGYGNYKTSVTYSCNSASYRLNGPSERQCQANGQWSGKEPTCELVNCGTLSSPYNGQGLKKGNSYQFSCLGGFTLIGNGVRNCQTDGSWSGKQPVCIPKYCPSLTAPSNGQLIGHSLSVNAAILATCKEGYMLQDQSSSYRICQNDRTWSGKDAKCIALSCGAPDAIKDGSIHGSRYLYKDQITYTCNSGYGLSGQNVRTCQLNGEWSEIAPSCRHNLCGYPGTPSNGKLVGDDYSFGSTVSYQCNAGYRLIGKSQIACSSSTGLWSGSKPTCQEILCPSRQAPVNGELSGNSRSIGAVITYDCKPGYSLRGPREVKCGSNGQWGQVAPTCIGGVCGAEKLVGPTGGVSSPGYPNSYQNNQYCRYKVVVAQSKKVAFNIPSFKTEPGKDMLELRDGKSGHLLFMLSGVLRDPLQITSPSNEMDVRFVTNNNVTFDGYTAKYFASPCGGQITSIGQVIQTPSYPSNYPHDISCSWQILIPNQRFKLQFDAFHTSDSHDKLEAWRSISSISSSSKIGTYSGFLGSFLEIKSTSVMYLKFTTNSVFTEKGFRATVVKDTSIY